MTTRIILVIDSLGDHTELLRGIISEAGCQNIRFTSVEHWRDSLSDATPAAVMISDAVSASEQSRIIASINGEFPGVPVVVLNDEAAAQTKTTLAVRSG